MDKSALKLIKSIEYCSVPKLSRNYDECENCPEYDIWKQSLERNFSTVLQAFEELVAKKNSRLSSKTLCSILILHKELISDGPWKTEKSEVYANKLHHYFECLYETSLENVLKKKLTFNTQEVFDQCMEKLNQKLTLNEFKKHPSLIIVYCLLMDDVRTYNIVINPLKVLPISLLLIDDYINTNRIKGLKSSYSILKCLSQNDFQDGNYYEVIYESQKKAFLEKDTEVTKLVIQCFTELYRSLPPDIKPAKTDDLYTNVLEQLHYETNLYRKATLFKFLSALVEIHEVNCINRKSFKNIICDNIDICCNEAVEEILFHHVLQTLEMWIKHCWCILQMSTDKRLLSVLFKYLYVCKEEMIAERIMNLIVTLINLCLQDDRIQMATSLEQLQDKDNKQDFQKKINFIKNNIKS